MVYYSRLHRQLDARSARIRLVFQEVDTGMLDASTSFAKMPGKLKELTARDVITDEGKFLQSFNDTISKPRRNDRTGVSGGIEAPGLEKSALFLAAAREDSRRRERKSEGNAKLRTPVSVDVPRETQPQPDFHSTPETHTEPTHDQCKAKTAPQSTFVKDPQSLVTFSDVRRTPSRVEDGLGAFAELLDAQVSTLQQVIELAAARGRIRDYETTPNGADKMADVVTELVSRDADVAIALLKALFERSAAIIIKLSYKQDPCPAEISLDPIHDETRRRYNILAGPIALLSHARLLVALLRCNYKNREFAALHCSGAIYDFLQHEYFYQALTEDRVAFAAGQLVREATSLAMHAQSQAC